MRGREDVDAAFAAFVAQRSGALIARATLLCGDDQAARDVVQGVLERAYPRWGRIERDDPLRYVNRAVTNAVTDWWRKAYRRHEVPTDVLPELEGTAGTWSADRAALLAALAVLTPRERTVVVLRYLDDLMERQVADALGVSVGTVKSTCASALRKLRVVLDEAAVAERRTS